ncbi:zinc finger protein 271-like [Cylas formicarius]|uniref:zinc finger protein 271-like n=1 Tax=Cylas formicarius TaxID=197179 RepID=UPI002958A7F4|nr:zinc finger protein 271-like [Cylas formicarius]
MSSEIRSEEEILRVILVSGSHSCNDCGKMYRHQGSLYKHQKYECGDKTKGFHCPYCAYRSYRKDNMKSHIFNRHKKLYLNQSPHQIATVSGDHYICFTCSKAYKVKKSLSRHLKYECKRVPSFFCSHCDHKSPPPLIQKKRKGEYRCPNCPKTYKYKTSVYTHLRNDCGQVPQYYCEPCKFVCRFEHVLLRHKRTLTHKKTELCGKLYIEVKSLILHLKVCGSVKFHCPYCNLEFKSKTWCYDCDSCGKSYKQMRSLKRHQRYECGRQPEFRCHLCSKRFFQKANPRKYVCPSCWRSYSRQGGLKQHQKHFCGKDAHIACPYPPCPYKSKVNFSMNKHILSVDWYRVTENGRYGCNKCISSYKNINNLRRHLRFECNRAPAFVCDVCFKRFTYKYILCRHMATHGISVERLLSANRLKCDRCLKTYTKSSFSFHRKYDCGDKVAYIPCDHCKYHTKRRGDLKKHCKRMHPAESLAKKTK